MSVADVVVYLMLGIILIGIPIYIVAQARERQVQKKLGIQSSKSAKAITPEQHRQLLKNIPLLLFVIGGGNILSVLLFSAMQVVSLGSIIQTITGISYIALGFGVQRKSKLALAVAIPLYTIEGIYNLISNAALTGWGWSACLSGGFILFVVMMLSQGIQSMEAIEKAEANQPGTPAASQTQDSDLLK